MNVPTRVGWTDECYAEKAEQAQQHPGTYTTINPAKNNCRKLCGPDETKSNAIMINPRKIHNNGTHSQSQAAWVDR